MIGELRVRDLATIADVTLHLGAGLNVLTGETGAGKSMLVDALSLLLGERADSSAVRPGAAKAVVEGAFESLDPVARQGGRTARARRRGRPHRRAARDLRRRPLPRLGQRQPHHRCRARPGGRAPRGPPRPARDPIAAPRRRAARHPRRLRAGRRRTRRPWRRRTPRWRSLSGGGGGAGGTPRRGPPPGRLPASRGRGDRPGQAQAG